MAQDIDRLETEIANDNDLASNNARNVGNDR